jgi:hypothetical protein
VYKGTDLYRTEFSYDYAGRRVSRIEKQGSTVLAERRCLYRGYELIQERDMLTGSVMRFYPEGEHRFTPAQYGGDWESPILISPAITRRLLHTRDHLGSLPHRKCGLQKLQGS